MHLGYQPTTEGNLKQIRLAAKALANARRPVIYGGGGIINANAAKEFREVGQVSGHVHADGPRRLPGRRRAVARHARHARDPHRELRDGRGGPDRGDRRPLRRPRHRQAVRVRARAKFIHIDVDPAEISKNVPAHIPIVGDAQNIVPKLTAEYRALGSDATRSRAGGSASRAGRRSTRSGMRRPPTARSSRSTWSRRCTRRRTARRS